jgi:hypothetical protein
MVFDTLALAAMAAGVLWASQRLRGELRVTDAVVPLLFLGGGAIHDLLFAFQLTFLVGSALCCVILVVLSVSPTLTLGRAGLVGGACICLPLCGANTLAMAPPLVLWSAGWGLALLRSDARARRRVGATLLASAIVTTLLAGLYLVSYEPARTGTGAGDSRSMAAAAAKWLAMSLGPAGRGFWPFSGLLAGGLFVVTLARLCLFVRRSASDRLAATGLLALGAGWVAMGLAVGWGRGGSWAAGFAWRYVNLATPVLAWVLLTSSRLWPGGTLDRLARPVLLLTLVALLPHNLGAELRWMRDTHELRVAFTRDVRAWRHMPQRLRGAMLEREHVGLGRMLPANGPRLVELLRQAELGPFRPPAVEATPALRPPVLVILAEDLGCEELGCYGGQGAATPAIDSIAERGLRFDQAWLNTAEPLADQLARARATSSIDLVLAQGDEGVGQRLAALERGGLLEETLVVLVGGPGDPPGEPVRSARRAGPPREWGTRIPLLVQWPARLSAGAPDGDPIGAVELVRDLAAASSRPGNPSGVLEPSER